MSSIEQAVSLFNEGFLCSQAVLSSFGQELGLDRETALRVSGVFGGGMRLGGPCGAVTGAFMVIGLKYGSIKADDVQAKEKAYGLVREFVNLFESRNGSIECTRLLGCDLSTPEGRMFAREKNLFTSVCPKFIRDAAEILEQIL